jgi:hypothetical protein
LNPNILECVDTALKKCSNSMKLLILIELEQNSHHFAMNIKTLLDTRPLDQIPDNKVLALAQVIYALYVPYISKYGIFEISHLCEQLQGIEFIYEDLRDMINALSHSLTKIMDYANEANTRCKLFTKGCGYPYLIKTFNVNFENFENFFIT